MVIGLLTLDLHFPGARSLKDKRQALRSLEQKLRNRLNVSVIAIDHSPLGYTPTLIEYLYIPAVLVLLPGVFIILTRLLPILGPVTSFSSPEETYKDPFH